MDASSCVIVTIEDQSENYFATSADKLTQKRLNYPMAHALKSGTCIQIRN